MRRAHIKLKLVTPAFLGGADPEAKAEWRAASIRGQWRWWFRALAGPRLGHDLAAVATAEAAIFGSSTAGASRIQVRTSPPSTAPLQVGWSYDRPARNAAELTQDWGLNPGDADFAATEARLRIVRHGNEIATRGVAYLGFGCMDTQGCLQRSCLDAGVELAFTLQWEERRWREIDPQWRTLAGDALQAWLLLGGIGARSRKGFGSLHLCEVEGDLPDGFELTTPRSSQQLHQALAPLIDTPGAPAPEWSQISRQSKIYLPVQAPTWQEALSRVGGWLMAYRRRYGIAGESRTALQHRDYEWVFGAPANPEIPDRSGFGLPLPFEKETVVTARSANGSVLRRASSLLIHVGLPNEGRYQVVLTHLAGRFLPPGARLTLGAPGVAPSAQQEDVVSRFLTDLVAKNRVDEVTVP